MRRFVVPSSERQVLGGHAPTFSVVIPAFEAAPFIGAAIESVIAQTVPAREIVVADDGSSDDLEGALARFGDRVRLVRGPHGGPPAARNRGFRAATGDFVMNLDADDLLHPERVEALGELAATYPDLDVLTSDANFVHDGRVLRRLYSEPWSFHAEDQRRWILRRNFLISFSAVRRSRFLELGGFDESILWADDWDFWIRLFDSGSRAGCVDEPLADYVVRDDSVSTRQTDVIRDEVRVLEKADRLLRLEGAEREELQRLIVGRRLDLARWEIRDAIARGDPDARSRALSAALNPGFSVQTRLKLAAAGIAPSLAHRLLRGRRTWVGAGGTIVGRD